MTNKYQDRARLARQAYIKLHGTTISTEEQANKLYADWVMKHQNTLSEALRLAADPDMVYVPREITTDMFVAFSEKWFSKRRCVDDCEMEDCYTAMIAAAPVATTEGE